jgi:phage regulator Rha-like protein
MGFTGEEAARIKEAYITAFDRMEKLLREHADLSQQNSFLQLKDRCMELQEELLQLYRKQVVQKRPRRRLTIDAMDEMRLLHKQGSSPAEIAEFTGHDEATVIYVLKLKFPNQS